MCFFARQLPYHGSCYTGEMCLAISNHLPVHTVPGARSHAISSKPAKPRSVPQIKYSVREGQRDRVKDRLLGCRKAIRVNRITVTAFGWLRLFKTHLRMGNFLSGSILGTPTFGSSRAQGPFSQGEGGESFFCSFSFCPFKGFFCERLRNACVAPSFSPFSCIS